MVEPLPGDTGDTCLAVLISRVAPARDQRKVGYPTVGRVMLRGVVVSNGDATRACGLFHRCQAYDWGQVDH